jgi:uncharacterized protein (TIGR02284 family)
METKHNLSDKTVSELKELIRANANSAEIFGKACELTDAPLLTTLFGDLRSERETQARELQRHLGASGERVEVETTLTAPLQNWFMGARNAFQGEQNVGVLSELERSEDRILDAYKNALTETAGSPLNAELHRQVEAVKKGHDRIKAMRDDARSRA